MARERSQAERDVSFAETLAELKLHAAKLLELAEALEKKAEETLNGDD